MKNYICKWLETNGVYSLRYRTQIAENAVRMVSGKKIDKEAFVSWIKNLDISKAMNSGVYFLKCLENELNSGRLIVKESATVAIPDAAAAKQTVEEFERSCDAWNKLIEESPRRGILLCDDNTNEVRAVADGEGGLIYIDDSDSERFNRFSELDLVEQSELSETVKVVNGSIAGLESVLRRMNYGAL